MNGGYTTMIPNNNILRCRAALICINNNKLCGACRMAYSVSSTPLKSFFEPKVKIIYGNSCTITDNK